MAIACYLAMTAAEFSACADLPPQIGWLACHFSPSGPGLSNIPKALPKHSLLIIDDSTPFHHHQPEVIVKQLRETIAALEVQAVILDFQRPDDSDVQALAAVLGGELPCPVAATPEYVGKDSPVFLPPCPLHRPLKEHLAPYHGREIWLDAAPLPVQITITPNGSHHQTMPMQQLRNMPHREPTLHCGYGIDIREDSVVFTFCRNQDAFQDWLREAEELGVTAAIGLYQEFRQQKPPC